MKSNQRSLLLGTLSYGIGVAVGFFLIFVAAWADMEAASYGFARLANAGLSGLNCPVLMTRKETRMISLNVSNPIDNQISPSIKTQISTSLLPAEFLEHIQLEPGESKRLEWAVGSENIDLGSFIFAKVLLFSAYPVPSKEATCGIFILDLPGSGEIILPMLVALSLLSMVWGLYRMNKSSPSNEHLKKHMGSMTFLAIMITLGIALSFVGGWIASLLVLVVSLLLILILFGSLFIDRSR